MKKSLPKIAAPIYEMTLPSDGSKVKYRPFTVREEKILLIARETKEVNQSILAMKQVINNCVIGLDVEKLPTFDLEYILLLLRSKSVDNMVKFSIMDDETNEKVDLELDLKEIKVTKSDSHDMNIKIDNDYILQMRYPTINEFQNLVENGTNNPEHTYDMMIDCMDNLISGDSVTSFSEFTREEIDDFAQNFTADVVKKIKEFFSTAPKLRHEIRYKNSAGKDKTFVIEGMETFFI